MKGVAWRHALAPHDALASRNALASRHERALARAAAVRGPAQSRAGKDAGSASPLGVAILAVVVCLTGTLAHVGAGLVADAQAQGAADLAALAAARVDRDSRAQGLTAASSLERACQAAADVSARNGASITACVRGANLSVKVAVTGASRGWPTSAAASARAGSTRH